MSARTATRPRPHRRALACTLLLITLAGARVLAQQSSEPSRTALHGSGFTLGALHRAAESHDARSAQSALLARQAALRTRTIASERLPVLSTVALAQYLSDVPSVGAVIPGAGVPRPPNSQYDAYLSIRQRLYDPTRAARQRTEAAQLTEQQARVQSAVYRQRQLVNDAYFAVLRADVQRATLVTAITDLSAQRRTAEQRRALGAALRSDVLLFDAELQRREQAVAALDAERRASLDVLRSITGLPVPDSLPVSHVLAVIDTTATALRVDSSGRARREYAQFDATRALLAERQRLLARQDAPRVSAFGRTGYGRPGLNQLARTFDSYWLAGVQVEWAPWTWGSTRREQDIQQVQREIVSTEEAAFTRELRDAATRLTASLSELDRSLQRDSTIIAMREQILRETRARYAERVITIAELVDRETDLLGARLERDQHVVQRAELSARLLTLLGMDVP